ncbi:hypothetical protein ACA910_011894 [Epithemia clementina (nom. ined.)]
MWNTFNNLAQKAKAVAADLEGQLDKSVGIDAGKQSTVETTPTDVADDDDDENAWNDDFPMDDDLDVSTRSNKHTTDSDTKSTPTQEDNTAVSEVEVADADATVPDDITGHESGADLSNFETVTDGQVLTESSPINNEDAFGENKAEVVEDSGVDDVGTNESADLLPSSSASIFKDTPPNAEPIQQDELPNGTPDPTEASLIENIGESVINQISSHVESSPLFVSEPEHVEANEEAPIEIPFDPVAEPEPSTPEATPAESTDETQENMDAALLNENQTLKQQVAALQNQLRQREEQLVSKTEQLTSVQNIYETEKQELEQRIENTKEEAKRRLAKAKERVEAAEKKVAALSSSSSDSAAQNEEIIAALRAEGEKLARKQLEMEKAVRTAKGEARELREHLEAEEQAKNNALEKIAKLEADLKSTKADLASARRGESQASKLEMELQSTREESERKAATILALEQQVKELKAASKDLMKQLEEARKGAALDSEREQKKLKKEHISMLEDLETKLRTTEKEAAVREDALRHEVAELRKRWQDAVRRADSLSMDVQSSTAPLLRQLESMERQNRTRAAGWATLEAKLRQELEDAVVASEQFQRERNELKSKAQRLERQFKENDAELHRIKTTHEEQTKNLQLLQTRLSETEADHAKQKQEWDESQTIANGAVARVRSEMTQTLVEAEEQHVSQLDSIGKELRQEREKRKQLEEQVQGFLERATGMVLPMESNGGMDERVKFQKNPPKKLGSGQGQAEILAGALNGFGDDDDAEEDQISTGAENDDDDDLLKPMNGSSSSFAALEALQSRLRVTKAELNTLRKSLEDSEKTREKLMAELAESRHARERLPVVEKMMESLTAENNEKTLEIQGLQEDIREVRELYRSQLNILIEEKAHINPEKENVGEAEGDGDAGSGWDDDD